MYSIMIRFRALERLTVVQLIYNCLQQLNEEMIAKIILGYTHSLSDIWIFFFGIRILFTLKYLC